MKIICKKHSIDRAMLRKKLKHWWIARDYIVKNFTALLKKNRNWNWNWRKKTFLEDAGNWKMKLSDRNESFIFVRNGNTYIIVTYMSRHYERIKGEKLPEWLRDYMKNLFNKK